MNSSTSSSENPRKSLWSSSEWKVLLILALVLLGTEVTLRFVEQRLSIDVAHIRSAPQLAASISGKSETAPQALKILFIGNSSIREGIVPELLVSEFKTRYGRDVRPYFFYPDGGSIMSWRWAWRRYFNDPACRPDLVVICGGTSHFDDGNTEPRIAGSYFVSSKDALAFASTELPNTESRLEFMMAKASISYASRRRVQRRVMDILMPYNRTVLFEVSTLAEKKAAKSKIDSPPTSKRLRSLLEDIRARHLQAVVVTVPNLNLYDVPEDRVRTIAEAGAFFADLRAVEGITAAHFFDKAHLDEKGAEIFTRALCSSLNQALAQPPKP